MLHMLDEGFIKTLTAGMGKSSFVRCFILWDIGNGYIQQIILE